MKDITILNTVYNLKNLIRHLFAPKLADFAKNNRPKGVEIQAICLRNEPEKQAVSLHNGLEKQAVSLRNGPEKQAVSLRNTNIIVFGTVTETQMPNSQAHYGD